MNERKKAFSTNWFFEGDLEEKQKLLKGRENRTLKHKKKNQRVSSNYVSSISLRSRWSFQREINLISV